MKKLMIAAAIVCVAAMSQAATYYNWQSSAALGYGEADPYAEDATWVGGTFYLMQGDATAAKTFTETLIAAGADSIASTFGTQVASAINHADYDATSWTMGNAAKGSWDDNAGGIVWGMSDTTSLPFYQVLLDTANNAFYVSEIGASDYAAVGNSTIGLFNTGYNTYVDAESYKGEGWYGFTTGGGGGGDDPSGGVPEPTSGLLMLVGLAGLSLRRRRA